MIDRRQATGHQVLTHLESPQLPHAMREHAHPLGWPEERLEVVEPAMGRPAPSPARRAASTRLARHGPAWSPLLARWASHPGLMADRAGVAEAATPNGRLLVGMQGIGSARAPPLDHGGFDFAP